MTAPHYTHLGSYSDLPAAARRSATLYPLARPGAATQRRVREVLAFDPHAGQPIEIREGESWERDGVAGQVVSWSVGYGPRTEAWVLRPAGATGPLPGVLALHDHGGFKFWGKEKIASGPGGGSDLQKDWTALAYGGRFFADELARRGYTVLVHDVFAWGSRKFDVFTDWDKMQGEALHARETMPINPPRLMPEEMSRYNWTAAVAEQTIQKYCQTLGTTFAGVIAFEDRVAAHYLTGRPDVAPGGVACIGLSGGGMRSTLLQATCHDIRAAVIVGAMSTYPGLLDHNVVSHTWMIYPSAEWARYGDWPDLAACRAPSPMLVQYDTEDPLFTLEGMQAADRRIAEHYRSVGAADHYTGQFYPGPHKFDGPMQDAAFAWLDQYGR